MIRTAFLACILLVQIEEPPFKAKEDFEIKLDLYFKQREHFDNGKTIRFNETVIEHERRTAEGLLPNLRLVIKILTVQSNEVKMKVIKDDDATILNKKVQEGMEFKLELGFTDDIKDKISGYKHVIQFFSPEKKVVSIIVIEFDGDGNYIVNGEKRGKI